MATSATPRRSASPLQPGSSSDLHNENESAGPGGKALKILIELLERLFDAIAVFFSAVVGYELYRMAGFGRRIEYSAGWLMASAFVFSVVFVLLLEHLGEYRSGSLLGVRETERVL